MSNAQSVFDFKKDMVWIPNANLYVCKYEVTNIEFRKFTDELIAATQDSISRKIVVDTFFPDTMVWINQFQHHMGDPMNKYYRWFPGFDGYPVVGVKYESAIKYCEWLTEKYGNGKYTFRLPAKKEFIQYAYVRPFNIAGGIESPIINQRRYTINYKPNITNLDDSISKVFYNPKNSTFMRVYNDTTEKSHYNEGIKPYTYHVENYYNGILYIGTYGKLYSYKIEDSLTFYIEETNSFTKVKPIFNTVSNYYNDGYMYTSPSRAMKEDKGLDGFEENDTVDYKTVFISDKSIYPADKNGLFDLAGNVSEMVIEKGCSMGGNWNSEFTELKYDYVFEYENPDVLIGFRIVAEPIK